MGKSTYSGHDCRLIDALVRGNGARSICRSCGHQGDLTARQLMERFHQHLDLPMSNVLAGAICRKCRKPVQVYLIGSVCPMEPDDGAKLRFPEENWAIMEARIRAYAGERG